MANKPGFFSGLFAKAAQSLPFRHGRSYVNWFRLLLPNTRIDYERKVGDGMGSNVFMAPLLWIGRAWMEATFAVVTDDGRGGEDTDTLHPLPVLLRKPNAFYSSAALWIATIISWFVDGNAYWIKLRDRSGVVRQLWYVPHWLIEPKGDEESEEADAFITKYVYRPGGAQEYLYDPADVVHLRFGLDPRNPRKGFSHMKMLLREIFNDDESANFTAAILLNSGVPGVIISPKDSDSVDEASLKATKEYIKDQFSGDNRGQPLALGGPTEVKEFGYDPQKMNLGHVRGTSEERVCATLALPAAVVGFGSGMAQTKVGATLAELHRIAWINCLIPNQDIMAQELTRCFRDDFRLADNQRLGFDRRRVRALAEDIYKEREMWLKEVTGGTRMVSEYRQAINLPVKPEHEIFLRPFSAIESGPGAQASADQQAQAPEPVAPPVAGPGAVPPKGKQVKTARGKLSRRQAVVLKAMDAVKARNVKRLQTRLGVFFAKMGESARAAYLSLPKTSDDELRTETVMSQVNIAARESELRGIIGQHYLAVYNETAGAMANLGIGVNVPDTYQLEILSRGGSQAGLIDLSQPAKSRVFDIIRDGREAGKGAEEIAAELSKAVPGGRFLDPYARAELIARNETRIAQTESALKVYESADGVDRVMIIDNRYDDPNDDSPCVEANGQIVTFIEAQGMIADEHPNGTRDLVPVFSQEAA
jgi:HK97 family phage portal protein